MATPPIDEQETAPSEDAAATGDRPARLGVWAALVLGFLIFLLVGSVSAISYRYNSFSGRVIRIDTDRSLTDIWHDQVAALPDFSVGWLPGAVYVLCIAVTALCAVAGAWMLLMHGDDGRARRSTRGG